MNIERKNANESTLKIPYEKQQNCPCKKIQQINAKN